MSKDGILHVCSPASLSAMRKYTPAVFAGVVRTALTLRADLA
jgi:hypothetical protein